METHAIIRKVDAMTLIQRETRNVPLESWEVGAELLDILSRGLYSDAKDALREYVQNGVDAGAEHIIVTIGGRRATIRDDGCGMDDDGIRAARRFGMSEKSPNQMVGYRGIGIYSAFGICEELIITSYQPGMDHVVGWRFEFGEMRRLLEADKQSEFRQGIGLPDLLHQYTQLFSEPFYGDRSEHFTVVEINGLGIEYAAQLNNAAMVNDYLLNTVPVALTSEGYGDTVNTWLHEHAELNPVRITLRISDDREFEVIPPVASQVYEPESGWITNQDGIAIAFVWYALSLTGRQIASYNGTSVNGFLLKLKGFTLGDRLLLKQLWPAVGGRTLYHHYTGEIHILPIAELYPNAARDGLEPSFNKQQFEKLSTDFFYPLSRKARAMQAMARAVKLLDGTAAVIDQYTLQKDDPTADLFKLNRDSVNARTDLENVLEEIARHLRSPKGRPKPEFDEIQTRNLDSVKKELSESIKKLGGVVKTTEQKTSPNRERRRSRRSQARPQVALLDKTLAATVAMSKSSTDPRVHEAVEGLRNLMMLRSVPRAIAILDDLKAAGIELDTPVESSRKELRSLIGWSPLAPVSLEEALLQSGISMETEREEQLIRAIDQGLIGGLGGRGEAYETILRAIADAIQQELEN